MLTRLSLCFALLTSTAHADGFAVGDTFMDPMEIAQSAFADFNYYGEGRPAITVDASVDFFNQMTILVAETGFADDSVDGVRNQYVLQQGDGEVWTIIFTRTDYRCGRGANTVTWQTNLCP
ncbi:hypothetical protein [Jannaschia sp. CCS1]|uniref:hypothetical protein n=1 Tax=Jannaschia sp. (strain CCS1) TaxID=290400 RepID=UPI000053CBE9|nr:hypothetical protein [Jannaschia sp. CCS1]ABD53047.1 hypothetical protein Jann_0130 [Jannaschia sp. CCS1]